MCEKASGKRILRAELLQKRRNISEKAEKDSAIFQKLIATQEFLSAELVLTYVSIGFEVDTIRLIEHCLESGIAVAIPGIVDDEMKFFKLEKLWAITDEVTDFDGSICVVPGLAFNNDNKRIGYGGGYYDRFLKKFKAKCYNNSNNSKYSIGLCYKEFIMNFPIENHDVGVCKVIWN